MLDPLPILAGAVTEENAGTAGMVAVALILASVVKQLVTWGIAKHNGKNGKKSKGNPGHGHSGVSKSEAMARETTRTRLADLHRWADEDRQDRTSDRKEILRLTREIAESSARIESATAKTLELHQPTDANGVPLWYVPRSWHEIQKQILAEQRDIKAGLERLGDRRS